MRARRLAFLGPREVRIETVELQPPGPGELLVRTEYSGISGGTELLAYRGEIDPSLPLDETLGSLRGTFAYPFSYAYSCVGRVERSAGTVAEGERVFVFHPHQDRFVVGEDQAVSLGAVDPRVATLLPLVETALQVTLDAGPRPADTVAVLGLGPVGILSAALLERSGAVVAGSDPDPSRREAAGAFGIRAIAPENVESEVRTRTEGRGADLVVEASGNPAALGEALVLLAHEGTVLVCSWYGTRPVALNLGAEFHRKRLAIRSTQVSTIPAAQRGSWTPARRRNEARRLMEELPLKALATHEFEFEQARLAYEALDRREPGLLHAAFRYP